MGKTEETAEETPGMNCFATRVIKTVIGNEPRRAVVRSSMGRPAGGRLWLLPLSLVLGVRPRTGLSGSIGFRL